MRKLFLIAAFAAFGMQSFAVGQADDVSKSPRAGTFFPIQKGVVLEYRYYDNNGKPLRDQWKNERWTRLTVEDTWGDSVANVAIENETFARLAEVETVRSIIDGLSYGDVRTTPTETVFENVIWQFLPEQLYLASADSDKALQANEMMRAMAEGSTTRVTLSAAIALPRELHVGDELPELRYEAVYSEEVPEETLAKRQEIMGKTNEMIAEVNIDDIPDESIRGLLEAVKSMDLSKPTVTTQTAIIRNRRVVAFEKAGEYDCWEITYDVVGPTERTPGIPKIKMGANGIPTVDDSPPAIVSYVDYISPEVGLVRREKLNFRGNRVEEVMTLTSVTR